VRLTNDADAAREFVVKTAVDRADCGFGSFVAGADGSEAAEVSVAVPARGSVDLAVVAGTAKFMQDRRTGAAQCAGITAAHRDGAWTFTAPQDMELNVRIFDLNGRCIFQSRGDGRVSWNAGRVRAGGMCLAKLTASGADRTIEQTRSLYITR